MNNNITDLVADIRNQLTPMATLISLLQQKEYREIPDGLIKSEVETASETLPIIVEKLNLIVELSKKKQ